MCLEISSGNLLIACLKTILNSLLGKIARKDELVATKKGRNYDDTSNEFFMPSRKKTFNLDGARNRTKEVFAQL